MTGLAYLDVQAEKHAEVANLRADDQRLTKRFAVELVANLFRLVLSTKGIKLHRWCERQGVCARSVPRALANVRLGWRLADELACGLGIHRRCLWPNW
ncbi:MAG: hypothetical protein ACRDK3_04465 [Actinomycetota bacterium]